MKSAEELAEKIADLVYAQIDRDGEWLDRNLAVKEIAAALQAARDEGLEEAANACDNDPNGACPECADLIRALRTGKKEGV